VFLHGHAANLEDGVNNLMTRFLHLESSFTSTIASLAPPRESNERLLPGGIYVLVAAMAGSIITRNRNILLRATVPVAAGIGAGYTVLPITTSNVGNLIWKYEEKYPVIRDNHLRVSQGVRHFLETGKAHSQMGLAMAEDRVVGVKEAVEQWVKQGK
jgi:organizing structure protein 2